MKEIALGLFQAFLRIFLIGALIAIGVLMKNYPFVISIINGLFMILFPIYFINNKELKNKTGSFLVEIGLDLIVVSWIIGLFLSWRQGLISFILVAIFIISYFLYKYYEEKD